MGSAWTIEWTLLTAEIRSARAREPRDTGRYCDQVVHRAELGFRIQSPNLPLHLGKKKKLVTFHPHTTSFSSSTLFPPFFYI